ncbi:hypothetical protein ABPG75_012486 [Micractinium tetrahymenae]
MGNMGLLPAVSSSPYKLYTRQRRTSEYLARKAEPCLNAVQVLQVSSSEAGAASGSSVSIARGPWQSAAPLPPASPPPDTRSAPSAASMADWRTAPKSPAEEAALREFARRQASKPAAPPGLATTASISAVPQPAAPAQLPAAPAPTQGSAAAQAAAPPSAAQHRECCICMDAEPVSVGVPCGHVGMCVTCAVSYLKAHTECPACARPLEALFVPGKGLLKPNKWAQAPKPSAWGPPQRA